MFSLKLKATPELLWNFKLKLVICFLLVLFFI